MVVGPQREATFFDAWWPDEYKVLSVGAMVVHVLEWPALDTLHPWVQSMSNCKGSIDTEMSIALVRVALFQCVKQFQHLQVLNLRKTT